MNTMRPQIETSRIAGQRVEPRRRNRLKEPRQSLRSAAWDRDGDWTASADSANLDQIGIHKVLFAVIHFTKDFRWTMIEP
jgi:hypothetical protein